MSLASPVKAAVASARKQAEAAVDRVFFDRRYGVETQTNVPLEQLGLAHAERTLYVPSSWLAMRQVLRELDVTRDDVLLDLGAGKGRAVLMAAEYPFARVIGVELSEELTRIARANVERNRARLRCGAVELVTSDVLHYEVPDDVTVAYLFAPFKGEIFTAVVDKILASYDRRPRLLRIVYNFPLEEEKLLRTGRIRKLKSFRTRRVGIYAVEPG